LQNFKNEKKMKNILLAFFVVAISFAHEKPKYQTNFPIQPITESPNYFGKKAKVIAPYDLCDGCGCGASGGSMGFASMLNSNFVGVRYFNQQYRSNDGLYTNSPWRNERFNTVQVWARIPVFKRFQISALIPYNYHERETTKENQSISGLGDITVLALATVYKTKSDTISNAFQHNLQAGVGVKLPTGAYKEANSGSVNPSFQLGTGSWDVLFSTEYVIKKKKLGWNNMVNYIVKNQNEKYYRFGNQFNYSSSFFYLLENETLAFAPQVGISGEVYGSNYQYNQEVKNTSGDVVFSKFGFELGYKKWSFGSTLQLPINQNLVGGLVEAKSRWSLNINFKL
jgi:hypothetical protein